MGNCMPLMHTAHAKHTTHVGSESMASTQEVTTAVDPINHTTINTNREFHNEESATYWLPKDEDEQKRLTGVSEHYVINNGLLFNLFYISNTLGVKNYLEGNKN